MEALGQQGGREALQAVTVLLYDDDPLLRTSTVRSLDFLPLHQRFQLLEPLFDDEITSVRMEVALSLAGVPLDQVSPEQAKALGALYQEYVAIMRQNADMPGAQMQLGVFYVTRGDLPSAETAYREALYLNPQLIPAHLNLADLLRTQSRDDEARKQLLQALAIAPESGDTLHALGLLETRGGEKDLALDYLGRAAGLETTSTRHRFVYAIALHDLGKPDQAIIELQNLLRTSPGNEEVLLALANYCAELGRKEQALAYAGVLVKRAPGNRGYQQLYQQLSQD
jgi:tetratricopeptide (TPR) repeat protein